MFYPTACIIYLFNMLHRSRIYRYYTLGPALSNLLEWKRNCISCQWDWINDSNTCNCGIVLMPMVSPLVCFLNLWYIHGNFRRNITFVHDCIHTASDKIKRIICVFFNNLTAMTCALCKQKDSFFWRKEFICSDGWEYFTKRIARIAISMTGPINLAEELRI